MTEPSKEAVDAVQAVLSEMGCSYVPQWKDQFARKTAHAVGQIERERWEREVRQRLLGALAWPITPGKALSITQAGLEAALDSIFEKGEPKAEDLEERVERAEVELTEAQAAFERKRQEDGP